MLPAVVAIVPVWQRPWRAAPLAESFAAATPGGRLLFVCSADDGAEREACQATGCDVVTVPGPRASGDWARKINAGYRASVEPLMLLGGDDVAFRAGWHEEVANAAALGFGVVGTQDLGNRRVLAGQHSTHPVVARWYADEHGTVDGPGAVVSECYDHNAVDDELVETARARGAWVFCNAAVVEHLHPNWGKAEPDDVYVVGRRHFHADLALLERRRHLWEADGR